MNSSIVQLDLNGQLFTGWKRFSFEDDMETLSSSFSFDLYDKSDSVTKSFRTGLDCVININNEGVGVDNFSILNGFIVNTNKNKSGTNSNFSVNGFDKLIDIVECSVIYRSQTWLNKRFSSIIKDILDPFAIGLDQTNLKSDPKIERFTIQSGESAFDAIERLCRNEAVLPLSTFAGDLLLGYSATENERAADLEYGSNILVINESVDWSERFSNYTGLAQYPGRGGRWKKDILQSREVAIDAGVTRYRPLLFIAEGKAERKTLRQRVRWEAQIRSGRSREYTVTVSGWYQKDVNGNISNQLWEKNKRVNLRYDDWDINEDRLITKVVFTLDENGELTILTLKHPDIFKQNPSEEVDLT